MYCLARAPVGPSRLVLLGNLTMPRRIAIIACICTIFSCLPLFSQECVRKCESRTCGDDGCGGICGICGSGDVCFEGSCIRLGVKVEISYPILLNNEIYPTFMTNLKASKLKAHLELAKIKLTNVSLDTTIPLVARIEIPFYSMPSERSLSIAPGKSVEIAISPVMDFPKLENVVQPTPSAVNISITSDDRVLYKDSKEVILAAREALFWRDPSSPPTTSNQMSETSPLAFMLANWVTPRDTKGEMARLIRDAANEMPDRSVHGYQEIFGPETCTVVMENEYIQVRRESRNGSIRFVSRRGETWPRLRLVSNDAHRRASAAHISAIFAALSKRGVTYVNTPAEFFRDSQNIKFPSQVLKTLSANCVEGALVFASALEAMGMRPVIVLIPGHAFAGVRVWEDDDTIIPIETTLVGKTTPQAAIDVAVKEYNDNLNNLYSVDIRGYRDRGLMPWPD